MDGSRLKAGEPMALAMILSFCWKMVAQWRSCRQEKRTGSAIEGGRLPKFTRFCGACSVETVHIIGNLNIEINRKALSSAVSIIARIKDHALDKILIAKIKPDPFGMVDPGAALAAPTHCCWQRLPLTVANVILRPANIFKRTTDSNRTASCCIHDRRL